MESSNIGDGLIYKARRFPTKISIRVLDEGVKWEQAYLGQCWRHTVPLHVLSPYPMFTTYHTLNRAATKTFCAVALVATMLYPFLGLSLLFLGFGILGGLVVIGLLIADCIIGPIRWATFDSVSTNRNVSYFQGTNADEFSGFTDQLVALIEGAQAKQSKIDNSAT